MNSNFLDLLGDKILNEEQKNALYVNLEKQEKDEDSSNVNVNGNAVIAAGAGSGKTQVLATRFAWLIMEDQYTDSKKSQKEKINVDEILTLTFTKKAAAEMYQRIYKTLTMAAQNELIDEEKRQRAKEALDNFANAHIQTLDSYCGKIVRQYASKYGIRPDFVTGSADASIEIKSKAFKFVLQNKEALGIQKFARPGKLQDFAEKTFGAAIERYTSLATEKDYFIRNFHIQLKIIVNAWNYFLGDNNAEAIYGENKEKRLCNILKEASDVLTYYKAADELITKKSEKKIKSTHTVYLGRVSELLEEYSREECRKIITYEDIRDNSENFKNQRVYFKNILLMIKQLPTAGKFKPVYEVLKQIDLSLYNSIFAFLDDSNLEALKSLNMLFSKFLEEINSSKRTSGNLSFNDVTEMAIKILLENEEPRNQEKNAFKKIMIDEFQDNNGKNRDLLYLLSLKDGAFEDNGKYIIKTDEIPLIDQIIVKDKDGNILEDKRSENKLFFVGDEKQSIYKFRGADVSVFNALTKNKEENALFRMSTNYRSDPALVEGFNIFFKDGNGIFTDEKKAWEANYGKGAIPKETEKTEDGDEIKDNKQDDKEINKVPIHINLIKTFNEKEKKVYFSEKEQIAYNIAKKIKELDNGKNNWTDFAILEHSRTDAGIITKYLNMFGIPYSIDQFSDIFEEGIINDFYNFFRLCVYPSDVHSYAAYLTSPFCGLNENALEFILSYLVPYAEESNTAIANLDIETLPEKMQIDINKLNPNNYNKFVLAIKFYKENKNKVLQQRITSTLSYLWNNKGYKYETYFSEKSQLISEHFDMFFELGRKTDEAGKNISWFVDQLAIEQNQYSQENPDIDLKEIAYPFERGNAVQVMTIHKSKGLEFPNVFIYGCINFRKKSDKNNIFFDDKFGITIKPDTGEKNYFSTIGEERAEAEELAEFRRLIYVAITRAENSVYIMGNWIPPKLNKERTTYEQYSSSSNFRLIETMVANNYYKPGIEPFDDSDYETHFNEGSAFDYTIIEPIEYKELTNPPCNNTKKSVDEQREYIIEKTEKIYDEKNADIINYISIPRFERKTPSSLEPSQDERDDKSSKGQFVDSDFNKKIATIVPSKLPSNDFGTIAHAYEEYMIKGMLDSYQPDSQLVKNLTSKELITLKEICTTMCHTFQESSLGQSLKKAKNNGDFYKTEWSFKMLYKGAIFNGSMDLIFSNGNGTYTIVDYKTDKNIEPENYIEQQHCYRAAASKLLDVEEKNISLYLYYLRYDKIVSLK